MADDVERADGRMLEALTETDVGDWLRAHDIHADAFNEVAKAIPTAADAVDDSHDGESRVLIAALGLMVGFEARTLRP